MQEVVSWYIHQESFLGGKDEVQSWQRAVAYELLPSYLT